MSKWSVLKDDLSTTTRLLRGSELVAVIHKPEYADSIASILTAAESIPKKVTFDILHGDDLDA